MSSWHGSTPCLKRRKKSSNHKSEGFDAGRGKKQGLTKTKKMSSIVLWTSDHHLIYTVALVDFISLFLERDSSPMRRPSTEIGNVSADIFNHPSKSIYEARYWCWMRRPDLQLTLQFIRKLFCRIEVKALCNSSSWTLNSSNHVSMDLADYTVTQSCCLCQTTATRFCCSQLYKIYFYATA